MQRVEAALGGQHETVQFLIHTHHPPNSAPFLQREPVATPPPGSLKTFHKYLTKVSKAEVAHHSKWGFLKHFHD